MSDILSWGHAVHHVMSGMVILREDGTIDKINDRLLSIISHWGLLPDVQLQGLSVFELSPELFGRPSFSTFCHDIYLPAIHSILRGDEHSFRMEHQIQLQQSIAWYLFEIHALTRGPQSTSHGAILSFTDITEFKNRETELRHALGHVCVLPEHIPICAVCKHVRSAGHWDPVESYLESKLPVHFTHDICPACIRRLYPRYSSILDHASSAEEE
ncbi:PAS domain-containing protein [Paenibacillus sp. JSM ZJ436]|uniref:PAS domain-containing protein n=1 Tax=Paenibacillus sp. JSM ZJ436 TaxID=3376190 RepID=UPI0037AD29D3